MVNNPKWYVIQIRKKKTTEYLKSQKIYKFTIICWFDQINK